MKSKNCLLYPKKRRGLSSVVGALLFVVLMVATFSVLGVALNTQTDIVSTARDVSDTDLKKQQEEFGIAVSTNGTEFLSIDVTNVGQNPVEIFTVVMTNITDAGFPTKIIEIPSDTSFIPSGDEDDIVSTLDLQMNLAPAANLISTYNFKVISSLGTIKTATLQCSFTECGSVTLGGDLVIQLFSDGPTGVNTKISSIIMFVTNTADFTYTDVTPTRGVSDAPAACNAGGTPFWTVVSGLPDVFPETIAPCDFDAFAPVDLGPNEFTIFKWDATLSGDIDSVFTFCNKIQGKDDLGVLQTFPPSAVCDDLIIIDPNDCGGCGPGGEGGETIILIDDLLIKPSIFMTIPSPFGDSKDGDTHKGLWGVNVANPTDQDMTISKVTVVAFPPGGNAGDVVFSGTKSGSKQCLEEDILPLLGPPIAGYWDCPRDNTLMWQNFTNPLMLPANSTKSFMVKVRSGDIFVANTNLDALIVQANVYSTFGSFGKAGYQTTMYEYDSPIVNVYLSDAADLRTGFIGNVNDIANFTEVTFNAVFADLDDNPLTFINAGAKFIINVPREWNFTELISCDGFDDVEDGDCDLTDTNFPSVTVHSDGSTQIIGTSTNIIGDGTTADFTDPSEAKKISFKAISAPVKFPRLYIMYILADGIVSTPDGDRTIGPLAEVVLNVDPPP